MSFHSILFDRPATDGRVNEREARELFADLNLDQIILSITAGRKEYDLGPFFCAPLSNVDTINYRHDILRDLEDRALLDHVRSFGQKMGTIRRRLAQEDKLHYKYQKLRWFLDVTAAYCDSVSTLADDLTLAELKSSGFLALREYLTTYTHSAEFTSLSAETKRLTDGLSGTRYCLRITNNQIRVTEYRSQVDYSADVDQTFAKFKRGAVKEHQFTFSPFPSVDHVQEAILSMVARLHPDIFSSLEQFADRHHTYVDATIDTFSREVQFYIGYLEYIERLQAAGLTFCYPTVTDQSKEVYGHEAFDLVLAHKLVSEGKTVVCNDFALKDPERILVVTGPNQGGKTTFARMFGQLHYLGILGLPVPGREARLFLADRVSTHFEREERIENLRGKLEDDLIRLHEILAQATSNSVVIMNESFMSTTVNDALTLSKKVIEEIVERDMLCVCVTFLDELASLTDSTVSMVGTVHPEDPSLRTYKIIRRPADGLAYAVAIAEKYNLTYDGVKRRVQA